jgi:hypothetical protein
LTGSGESTEESATTNAETTDAETTDAETTDAETTDAETTDASAAEYAVKQREEPVVVSERPASSALRLSSVFSAHG